MNVVTLHLSSPWQRAWVFIVLALVAGSGCAHSVIIDTAPIGARVSVDGEFVGVSPVTIDRVVFFGDQLRISADAPGYEEAHVSIPASEWYPWPGLLAAIPLLGVPLSLPALLVPLAGPFIAAAIAVSWAVLTSPTLLSLALVRKYPDVVTVTLKPKRAPRPADFGVVPGDIFGYPEDLGPNPLPDVAPSPQSTSPPSSSKRPPPGSNPIP